MPDLRFLPECDALIAPLAGDPPGGDRRLFMAVKDQVERLRRDDDPDLFQPDDPMRPKEFKPADWAGVLRTCVPLLRDKAKDLRLARYVVDALPRREEAERARNRSAAVTAFAALADGLAFLRALTADGWEYVHPEFDPDEPDTRNGPFDWLGNDDGGAALPQLVRSLPVAVGGGKPITQRAWATAQGDDRAALQSAAAQADPAAVVAVRDDLLRCGEELAALRQVLAAKVGPAAPGLNGLQAALADALVLARGLLAGRPDAGQPAEGAADTPGAPQPGGGPAAPAATRESAYVALRQAAELLRRLEPHSPVPYLVLRAVELGGLPFPEMIKSFVRDDDILTEMRRELNIPEQSSD
jgi:type VI secretion system protein ImpA